MNFTIFLKNGRALEVTVEYDKLKPHGSTNIEVYDRTNNVEVDLETMPGHEWEEIQAALEDELVSKNKPKYYN